MNFRILQSRLIEYVRERVSNGELTERGLARRSGISQPHLHNILKGIRVLSAEMADQIMCSLNIGVQHLMPPEPTSQAERKVQKYRSVPVLQGLIGPGHPYPIIQAGHEEYSFLESDLERVGYPIAGRLAEDPLLAGLLSHGAIALLDRAESCRLDPDEESYYALDLPGESAIRQLRVRAGGLYLVTPSAPDDSSQWQAVPIPNPNLLSLVRGRVSLIVHRL